jgi:uncharacterized lipoprotein YbaY
MGNPVTVVVNVVIGPQAERFADAMVRVTLEDVTLADAPALIVGTQTLSGISHEPGREQRVTMRVSVDDIDTRRRYVVRALVDRQGDGKIHRGDLATVQSYPVLTRGHPTEVDVQLKEIQ